MKPEEQWWIYGTYQANYTKVGGKYYRVNVWNGLGYRSEDYFNEEDAKDQVDYWLFRFKEEGY